MPLAEAHTAIQITKRGRWKLKRLAVEREQPMYKVLEELIDAAAQAPTHNPESTDTHAHITHHKT